MAIDQINKNRRFFKTEAEQEALRKLARGIRARAGIPDVPTMTLEELLASQQANGIRPEDNGASRDLICQRYGENDEID